MCASYASTPTIDHFNGEINSSKKKLTLRSLRICDISGNTQRYTGRTQPHGDHIDRVIGSQLFRRGIWRWRRGAIVVYGAGGLVPVVLQAGGIGDEVGDTASRPPEQIEDLQTLHPGRAGCHNWFTIGSHVSPPDPAYGKVVLLVISKANEAAGIGRRFDGGGG